MRDAHATSSRASSSAPTARRCGRSTNNDFVDNTDGKGGKHRLPGKTRFQTATQNGDLIIDWKNVEVNVDIDPGKFKLALQGLQACAAHP